MPDLLWNPARKRILKKKIVCEKILFRNGKVYGKEKTGGEPSGFCIVIGKACMLWLFSICFYSFQD